MANPAHIAVVRQGAEALRVWRGRHPRARLDLTGANLAGATLAGATLRGANLRGADLAEANLVGANLSGANLAGANLSEAHLFGADLTRANLSSATLTRADLTGAKLGRALLSFTVFHGTSLTGADLSLAWMRATSFSLCDLSGCVGLETVAHEGESSIGVDTLIRTLQGAGGHFTEEQLRFFESAGVPGHLLDYLPSLVDLNAFKFYSCLIAYTDASEEDKAFSDRLYDALKACGVDRWMYERDALIGRRPWDQIRVAMHNFEKVLVVCSRTSLGRSGVLKEIDDALAREAALKDLRDRMEREAREAGRPAPFLDTDVLFPIRLDDAIRTWDDPRKQAILDNHHVGDFTGWRDEAKFEEALGGLLKALDPRSWPPPEARTQPPSRP